MKVLAYFLYGNDREYLQELQFSIVSAMRFLQNQDEIVVRLICDSDQIDLPIERLVFSPKEFATWTRDRTYPFRAKIGAALKAIDHYQCPVILLDTDTFFTDHPAKLFDRISRTRSLMHQYESTLLESPEPGWKPILEKQIKIDEIAVVPGSPMYNSGVIGVHPSNRALLEEAFEILDRLYEIFPVFNIEQFAVGAALAQKTVISTCPDVIQHYWGAQKDFIRVKIAKALEQGNAELLLNQIPPFQGIYPKVRKRDRILTALSYLKHWNNNYRRALLAYRSALFYAANDTEYANAWASNALQALKISNHPSHHADFQCFRQESINTVTWLRPSVRRGWLKFWQQMN
ncbi:hypothetical protein ACQ4M3_37690 [Leptolyngbya sp. AN03gr2]|uniref:hypothetical protein n=1 Tax=unclassified Leptolyngbya TaxID=2650499 RepID=UPI003D321643